MNKTIEEAARIEREKVCKDLKHAYEIHKDIQHYATATACIDKYAIDLFKAGADFSLTHQWRSVEDELPEDDDTVFVSDENGYHIASYFNGEWYSSDDEFTRNPQMWMPIPSLNPEQR